MKNTNFILCLLTLAVCVAFTMLFYGFHNKIKAYNGLEKTKYMQNAKDFKFEEENKEVFLPYDIE
ncbi:MAG: hypothetical protein RR052_04825 [Oscillospiraceae bacterium]